MTYLIQTMILLISFALSKRADFMSKQFENRWLMGSQMKKVIKYQEIRKKLAGINLIMALIVFPLILFDELQWAGICLCITCLASVCNWHLCWLTLKKLNSDK